MVHINSLQKEASPSSAQDTLTTWTMSGLISSSKEMLKCHLKTGLKPFQLIQTQSFLCSVSTGIIICN